VLFPGAVEAEHVDATKRIVIPRVRILLPTVPTGNFESLFKYLPESVSMWPLSYGITPRAFQRIKVFNTVYPEFSEAIDLAQVHEDTMNELDKKQRDADEKKAEKEKEQKKKKKEKGKEKSKKKKKKAKKADGGKPKAKKAKTSE